ncbi:MAG: ATP-binding protein [Candidatus Aminicenantes bacterium]|nr:ATP-binding protein [Candidatus Aminicenantes bacterium]
MRVKETTSLEVTVDKRHIISIGERLYTESVELLRELVNNAYDADATEVRVDIEPERVVVQDNGTGMDAEGLRQYFRIGSDEKLLRSVSPRFGRDRVGQFGIGKFASLAAAVKYEIITRRGDFAARVVFDKRHWESSRFTWHLPCEILQPEVLPGDGTTVILSDLTKTFNPEESEETIKDGVPLKAANFAVFLNGRLVPPRVYAGQRIPVLEGCPFGAVAGEIVIIPKSAATTKDLGIDVKVKGVTVKKELFGMETWGPAMARVKGEINANFLPVTSDRSNFVADSDEYQEFLKVMAKVVAVIEKRLGKDADRQEDRRAGRAVNEALQRIRRALALNPDFSPFGPVPYGDEKGVGGAASEGTPPSRDKTIDPDGGAPPVASKPKPKRRRNPLVKKVTPNAIVRRVKLGQSAVSVCLDFFGENARECFTEGNVIYVNRDHPLFKREARKSASFTMYVARLMTQEIALMKETKSPRLAFARQSKLLKDAFVDALPAEAAPAGDPAPQTRKNHVK